MGTNSQQLLEKNENKVRIEDIDSKHSAEEYKKIIYEWNDTDKIYQSKITIHRLFEKQVAINPSKIAVKSIGGSLTYHELNIKVNQLADYLINQYAIKKEDRVCVCLDRSENILIALLAILKTGAAYVPLDIQYPENRIQSILADCEPTILITIKDYEKRLSKLTTKVFSLDDESIRHRLSRSSIKKPNVKVYSDNLAYIIYTSGTTGKPKGVMIEHHSLNNLVQSQSEVFFDDDLRQYNCLNYANYVFDAHASEIYTSLLNGHTLHIIGDELRHDITLLSRYIEENKIDLATIPPALLNEETILRLNTLIVAGEVAERKVLDKYLSYGVKVINAYGPSESTVCSSMNHYQGGLVTNIGKPISNIKCYVLDNDLKPLGINEIGELCLGGVGLSRGYLNKPALTNEKFIANPFQTQEEKKALKNSRLYKTGDLVRWNPDGNLEYIGRNDFQVKLRGNRIELGEIEERIKDIPRVKQCVVIVDNINPKNKYLVAYYVSSNKVADENIQSHLRAHLVSYKIPSAFVHLDKLPLTINGKLDRASLPKYDFADKRQYNPPRNQIESELCQIWADELGLRLEQVGVKDDFFNLGGSSILAIKVISRFNASNNLFLSTLSLFNARTIEKLCLLSQADSNKSQSSKTCLTSNTNDLHHFEEIILRHYLSNPDEQVYNESVVIEFDELIDPDIFNKAVESLISRHNLLNTNYKIENNQISKSIQLNSKLICENFNCRGVKYTEVEFKSKISSLVKIPFDLSNDKLIRFYLFNNIDGNKSRVLIVFFHSILDGTSITNNILPELYRRIKSNNDSESVCSRSADEFDSFSKKLEAHYLINNQDKIEYWNKLLSRNIPISLGSLSGNNGGANQTDSSGKQKAFRINLKSKNAVYFLSKDHHVSEFNILISCFALLLYKFTGQTNLAIKTNIDERLFFPEHENTLGCFINNIFTEFSVDDRSNLLKLVQASELNTLTAIENALPYSELLKINRDRSIELSDVHFNLEPIEVENDDYLQSQIYTHSGDVKNGLYFELDIKSDCILGRVEYKTNQYDDHLIQSLIESYIAILDNLESNLVKPIYEIDVIDPGSKNKILDVWSNKDSNNANKNGLLELFEEQVEQTPNNIALTYKGTSLTYRELNNKSNQLASYLYKSFEIKPDDLICLCLNRSEYLLISILAVLKTGAAYVPIDPNHPNDRAKHILEDTKSQLLLTNETYSNRFKDLDIQILGIDSVFTKKEISFQKTNNLNIDRGSLVYVLYTSGTTGAPKGVVLEERGCVSRILYMIQESQLTPNDVVLFKTNYIFDVSFSDIFTTLLSGAKLVITHNVFDIDEIKSHLEFSDVSVCHFVPSQFLAIKNNLEFSKYPRLTRLLFSGEKITSSIFDNIGVDNLTILNYYGPTETGEVTLNKFYTNELDQSEIIHSSIGKPFCSIQCYILDSQLNPVPIGVPGELYIGGVGVAKGYLHKPALTTQKFILNPFNSQCDNLDASNNIIYKTGDVVCWLPDGSINYIGRNDSQVKIRGQRVELSEIENSLSRCPGVKQCCITFNKLNNCDHIVGYYVADKQLDENTINKNLKKTLPEFMLPSILIRLDEFPLTSNGKLDKTKLPEAQFEGNRTRISPRNDLESKLVSLLSQVLYLPEDTIGIRDDFFKIGGDSILAITFIYEIKNRFGINISVKDLFRYKTIEGLYDSILTTDQTSLLVPTHSEEDIFSGDFKLLPIQKWFFGLNLTLANHWNQSFIVRTPELSLDRLQSSVDELVKYHDAFKLRYINNGFDCKQYYKNDTEFQQIRTLDVSTLGCVEESKEFSEKLDEILTNWQSKFNLQNGPVFTIAYLYGYKDRTARIYFALHHLITDSVSWRILVEDLQALYEGKRLSFKSASYRRWVGAVKSYSNRNFDEASYWKTILSDHNPTNILSSDAEDNAHVSRGEIVLSNKLTTLLVQRSNHRYCTQINDLLLTALGVSLSYITKSTVNHILLEGHGREEIAEGIDISKTVGWFTTLFPVRLEVIESNIGDSIKNIKETLSLIPNKGIGYGELVGYSGITLPKVSFNYLGQFNSASEATVSTWEIVNESSGQFVSPENSIYNDTIINGLIIDRCLRFYIQSQLSQDVVDNFVALFEKSLTEVITHCSLNRNSQNTISDYDDFDPYVTYISSESKKNVFLLPPGKGGAESYLNNIVPRLKDDFNLIIFNNFYSYLRITKKIPLNDLTHITYEFLASLYISYIKHIQPRGPYTFIGWSFGGVLAYEITRQLIARGEVIDNLALLDAYFNYRGVADLTLPNGETVVNDINYKYDPVVENLPELKILYFKCLHEIGLSDLTFESGISEAKRELDVHNYYARRSSDNYLHSVAPGADITIVKLDAAHINLLETQVEIICKKICEEFDVN